MLISILWCQSDSNKTSAYKVSDLIAEKEFPIFPYIAAESISDRNLRWKSSFHDLAEQQRHYLRSRILIAFRDAFTVCINVDDTLAFQIKAKVKAVVDSLAATQNLKINYDVLVKGQCAELTLIYSLGSMSHSIHVCNLSPSEYENEKLH